MILGNNRKGLLVFLSLLVASAVSAAPIVTDNSRNFVTPALSVSADAHLLSYEINLTNKFYNPGLASVAAELFKPPAIIDLPSSNTSVKSLPAVPGTLFMVLAGFLCVSLVNDRRVWLTVLAGLLWLSQTGFAALPHLASHLLSKKQIQQSVAGGQSLTYISELDGSYRPRSDLDGTQYIGLLRHLAGIPATAQSVKRGAYTMHEGRWTKDDARYTNAVRHLDDKVSQFAIIKLLPEVTLSTDCLVFTTGQAVPFSPAFIFSRLARGPPQPT